MGRGQGGGQGGRWEGGREGEGEGTGGKGEGERNQESLTFSKLCWCPWKTLSSLSAGAKGLASHTRTGGERGHTCVTWQSVVPHIFAYFDCITVFEAQNIPVLPYDVMVSTK